MEAYKRWRNATAQELPQALLDEVHLFSGGHLRDDVAVVALMLNPDLEAKRPTNGWHQEELACL